MTALLSEIRIVSYPRFSSCFSTFIGLVRSCCTFARILLHVVEFDWRNQ